MRFLSTPSARRATIRLDVQRQGERQISIHALREEGDLARRVFRSRRSDFYPRPPRGGRPCYLDAPPEWLGISIHALREEGDLGSAS